MTAVVEEELTQETDPGLDEELRHLHCAVCWPTSEHPPGSKVIAFCGTPKINRGIVVKNDADMDDVHCVVCSDVKMMLLHALSHKLG